MERAGATAEDLLDYLGYRRNRIAQLDGDLAGGEAYSGASVGLIKEVLSTDEVIQSLVEGYQKILKSLN